jgi:hypothetical protein
MKKLSFGAICVYAMNIKLRRIVESMIAAIGLGALCVSAPAENMLYPERGPGGPHDYGAFSEYRWSVCQLSSQAYVTCLQEAKIDPLFNDHGVFAFAWGSTYQEATRSARAECKRRAEAQGVDFGKVIWPDGKKGTRYSLFDPKKYNPPGCITEKTIQWGQRVYGVLGHHENTFDRDGQVVIGYGSTKEMAMKYCTEHGSIPGKHVCGPEIIGGQTTKPWWVEKAWTNDPSIEHGY